MNKDKYSNVVLLVDPSPPHNSILPHYRFTFIEKKEEGDVGFCFSDKDFWDNNQINRFMYLYNKYCMLGGINPNFALVFRRYMKETGNDFKLQEKIFHR